MVSKSMITSRAIGAAIILIVVATVQVHSQEIGIEPPRPFPQPPGCCPQLTAEQKTKIREYVLREKVPPAIVRERLSVGSQLPASVELRPIPSDWGPTASKYRYVYSGDHVILVEPTTRRVIQVIE
jgi:hypothetical protein